MVDFFEKPQAAAVLKHGILRRYLPVFANKTGSVAGEVAYLDCFAGPGYYEDRSDGSPALALQTAEVLAGYSGKATLHGYLIEKDLDSLESLKRMVEDHDAGWNVYEGRAEEHVPTIIDSLDQSTPVFAFIDPFGLPIPFQMVVDMMKRRAPVEVLMNFSSSGINRVGGQLTGKGVDPTWLRARDTMVQRMDAAMGGDWWHEIWESKDPDRVDRIRSEYSRRLRSAAGGGWGCFDLDVSDRWQGPAAYHLLLFTQHPDGAWHFNEALSSAQEEYRQHCHDHEGMLDLEPLETREAQWIDHIEANVDRLLEEGSFTPVHHMPEVYGDAFGEAREKHLRKALKRLHKAGKLRIEPKGKLESLTLRR